MPNFFAAGDLLARLLLLVLPRRISARIKENTSPLDVLVLRTSTVRRGAASGPRMTPFEGVFATLLFDLALFGTSNPLINGAIRLFTTIQNSWDRPFESEAQATAKVDEFCDRLNIQREPWVWEKEAGGYASLNDFFSRTYAPEHFPPIGGGRVASPACCKLRTYRDDAAMASLLIKGCDYAIGRIGLPEEDLGGYASHPVFLGYLSPTDYHRVHAPVSGRCVHCRMEGAEAPSASVKFFDGGFNLLNENKRLVVVLEEEEGEEGAVTANDDDDAPLRVALVIVGGVGVNTITYDAGMVGERIEKGQELSAFRAGGR